AKSDTRDKPFHLAAADSVRVPMMSQLESFSYSEAPGMQVVRLPYADHRLSMVVVLPRRRAGLAAIERGLTSTALDGWLGHAASRRVDLELPRFTFTHEVELSGPLSALGMPTAFANAADFSGMSARPTHISKVLHKAFVDVDESGTEAAGATGVVMGLTMAAPPPHEPPIVFHADHPFLFLIRDDASGAILFM